MKKLMMAALVAAMAGGMALAQAPGRGMPPMGREMMMGGDPILRMVSNPRFADKIGLSAEQKTKIQEIEKASRNASKASRDKMREANEKQMQAMNAEKPDEAAVMAAIDGVFEIRKEMAKAQAKRSLAIKALLTPEQLEKAKTEMRNGRGRRPPRHMPPSANPPPDKKPDAAPDKKPDAAPDKKPDAAPDKK